MCDYMQLLPQKDPSLLELSVSNVDKFLKLLVCVLNDIFDPAFYIYVCGSAESVLSCYTVSSVYER